MEVWRDMPLFSSRVTMRMLAVCDADAAGAEGLGPDFQSVEGERKTRTFDYVVSLGVGEHIPPRLAHHYIDNRVRYARARERRRESEGDDGGGRSPSLPTSILLSWAFSAQDGRGHVNWRSNTRVVGHRNDRGFMLDVLRTRAMRSSISGAAVWPQQSLVLLERGSPRVTESALPRVAARCKAK